MRIPLSILDLVPVGAGTRAADAVRRTVDLAQLAERTGHTRLWFAEHHGMPAVASAAPEVLIAHVAAHTRTLRVGSGGVMLPNHAPLRVAEAFRTLSALHPGRIDLGLGRAPGSDVLATRALRAFDGEQFPALLQELLTRSRQRTLPPDHPMAALHAMPGDAPLPPVWMLGSSGASARLAGELGMGYSFASHFSPTPAAPAFDTYREAFVPSPQFTEPHAILGVAMVCAPTMDEANVLASSMDLAWLRIRQGRFEPLPSPEEALAYPYTESDRRVIATYRRLAVVGDPTFVATEIERRARQCEASEVMVVSNLPDPVARLRSHALLAEALA